MAKQITFTFPATTHSNMPKQLTIDFPVTDDKIDLGNGDFMSIKNFIYMWLDANIPLKNIEIKHCNLCNSYLDLDDLCINPDCPNYNKEEE
jgi:hypothetical protein